MSDEPTKMRAWLHEQLPKIDDAAARADTSLMERPLRAATFIVEHCMVEVEGGKDDYMGTGWFAELYSDVYLWYLEKYGRALVSGNDDAITSIARYSGVVMEYEVPTVVEGTTDEPDQMWFEFPFRILDDENPIDWVDDPPNFDAMSEADLGEFEEEVRRRGNDLRRIAVDYQLGIYESQEIEQMAARILPQLNAAAEYILQEPRPSMLAIEQSHLAAEKALKVLLNQSSVDPPHTHELSDLYDLAQEQAPALDCQEAVDAMLDWAEVNGHRYGEVSPRPRSELVEIYDAALTIVRECGQQLDRDTDLEGQRFVIERPEFAKRLHEKVEE